THITHQGKVVREAYERSGLIYKPTNHRIIERELAEYELADRIAVPTHFAAKTFVERGFAPDKIIVNPYGSTLSAGKTRRRPPGAITRILFVGGVGPRKGIPTLLDAFSDLSQPAELVLAGPVEQGMETLLAGRQRQSVSVLGAVSADRVAEEMADADIFCLPSVEEGLSLALLQALGAGLPVVATAESGAEDVIEQGREGFIVPVHDQAALTERLEFLIDNPPLRDEMAIAAKRRVAEGFGWSDYGDRAVALYNQVLGG
ncbi:MAG: glycosyltransferase family 4 protein, partial [Proteobacteria bacterium]|nr:glycosyltransferase family 4 protein [Pseudomonadota bacterium]